MGPDSVISSARERCERDDAYTEWAHCAGRLHEIGQDASAPLWSRRAAYWMTIGAVLKPDPRGVRLEAA